MNARAGRLERPCGTAAAATASPRSAPAALGPPPALYASEPRAAGAEAAEFTGQIVYNGDGSVAVVDADVPWVSAPDSVIDDGRAGRTGAVPPAISSVLFIHRQRMLGARRADAGARLETKVPDGLTVDRYRVCDVAEARAASDRAPDTLDAAAAAAAQGASHPSRTNFMCCVCRLSFGAASSFVAHSAGKHGLALSSGEVRFLSGGGGGGGAGGLLTAAGGRRPSMALLRHYPLDASPGKGADAPGPVAAGEAEDGSCAREVSGGQDGASALPPSVPSVSAAEDVQGRVFLSHGHPAVLPPDGEILSGATSSPGTMARADEESAPSQPQVHSSQPSVAAVVSQSACKTLKCPRCNWHFKYQETLEVHMREKHPEGGAICLFCVTGRPHPKLARGDAYECGYKPYRCGVCHYATTTKGNLSIHMQSDKHLNNMQEWRKVHGDLRTRLSTALHDVKQADAGSVSAAHDQPAFDSSRISHPNGSFEDVERNCHLLGLQTGLAEALRQRLGSQTGAIGSMPAKGPGSSVDTALDQSVLRVVENEGEMSPTERDRSRSKGLPSEDPTELADPNPTHVFNCCTCSGFSTDSLEELGHHVSQDRSRPSVANATTMEGGNHVCRLCAYKTHLKANFQLHCQTDKHLQKLQLFSHIMEGGDSNARKLRLLHSTSSGSVRCNVCELSTRSVAQLRAHAVHKGHDVRRVLFEHLRRAERHVPASRRSYGCALCDFAARQKLPLLRHIGGARHLEMERRRQLRRRADGRREPDHVAAIFAVREAADEADDPAVHPGDSEPTNGHGDWRPSETPERLQNRGASELRKRPGGLLSDADMSAADTVLTPSAEASDMKKPSDGRQCAAKPPQNNHREIGAISPVKNDLALDRDVTNTQQIQPKCDADAKHDATVANSVEICVEMRNYVPLGHGLNLNNGNSMVPPSSEKKTRCPGSDAELPAQRCDQTHHDYATGACNTGHSVSEDHSRRAGLLQAAECHAPAHGNDKDDTRPFKCDTCKVAYSHPQILSIHLQSASHQSRLTKSLEAVAASACNQPVQTGTCAGQLPAEARAEEVAATKGPSLSSLLSADGAGSMQRHAEASLAHFTGSAGKDVGGPNPDGGQQRQKMKDAIVERQVAQGSMLTNNEMTVVQSGSVNESQSVPSSGKQPVTLKNQLLEAYGLEIAMHHCESRWKRRKSQADCNSKPSGADGGKHKQAASNAAEWVCRVCQKEFSSLWIRRFHEEKVHDRCVPKEELELCVERLSRDFRTERLTVADGDEQTSPTISEETPAGDSQRVEHISELSGSRKVSSRSHVQPSGALPTPISRQSPAASDAVPSDGASEPLSHAQPRDAAESRAAPTSQPTLPDLQTALGLIQAAHIRYQMQQLAAMGSPLGVFGLGAAADADAQASLLSLMAAQQLLSPGMLWAAQAQALAQQRAQASPVLPVSGQAPHSHSRPSRGDGQAKRVRTRISGSQLKVLRAHFDINHSPSEEEVNRVARCCGLGPKVVKHWFRNTLFKERQRNKDSPYNFSVPPTTILDVEKYQRMGSESSSAPEPSDQRSEKLQSSCGETVKHAERGATLRTQGSPAATSAESQSMGSVSSWTPNLSCHFTSAPRPATDVTSRLFCHAPPPLAHNGSLSSSVASFPENLSARPDWRSPHTSVFDELTISLSSSSSSQPAFSPECSSPAKRSPQWSQVSPPGSSGHKYAGRRANRTRFTDQQVKVLQDFFEKNAYPKEDDLRRLSKLLNLGPRVIVVWFQNARQKVRKVYENQPPSDRADENASRFQRTASLNYQCNRCLTVYQRYHELIRHQRQHCYREEGEKQLGKAQESGGDVTVSLASSLPALGLAPPQQESTFKCGKCLQQFDRFDRWREHQVLHVMNPSLVPSSLQNQSSGGAPNTPSVRPSHSAEEASEDDEAEGQSSWERLANDKRLRTSIHPEQLQHLHRQYQADPCPSRETLEAIARDTGLKKRVVQVWFQNSRARERKGQGTRRLSVGDACLTPLVTPLKTRAAESALLPEVSIELVSTCPDPAKKDLVPTRNGAHPSQAGFPGLVRPPPERPLQISFFPSADAPLDLSKPQPSAATGGGPAELATAVDPTRGAAAARGDAACLSVPWTARDATDADGARSSGAASPAAARQPLTTSSKRFRTQMSAAQVGVLRSVFAAYRMPTMVECSRLGEEIGLAKRVVQVWFQNSRAKDKKRHLQSGRPPTPPPLGCDYCQVLYGVKCSLQEHLLSRAHIESVRRATEEGRTPPAAGGARESVLPPGRTAAEEGRAPPPPGGARESVLPPDRTAAEEGRAPPPPAGGAREPLPPSGRTASPPPTVGDGTASADRLDRPRPSLGRRKTTPEEHQDGARQPPHLRELGAGDGATSAEHHPAPTSPQPPTTAEDRVGRATTCPADGSGDAPSGFIGGAVGSQRAGAATPVVTSVG
ncbi:zinc finger homeobox protein 4-like [Pollicipes pollicipes]|uniref:zinc finger homeobox protein 4-like n=1 Tax=Pollicipes pollicipes TaxID=41117 RepID=UPI0018852AA9|nr:zinc finger homeobox protein 4-like [Pollicipes pollicipes]